MRPRNQIFRLVVGLLACLGMLWGSSALAIYEIPVSGPYAYITNYSSNSVSVVDTAYNGVAIEIPVGSGPYGVAIHPNSSTVYVTNYASGSVSVINAVNNVVTSTITLPNTNGAVRPYGIDISPDGSRLFVTAYTNNSVLVIDTTTNQVTATIPVGSNPRAVLVSRDGSHAYVANFGSNAVSVINTSNNTVSNTIALPASTGPIGLMITPDNRTLYVTAYSSNKVYAIDTATNTVKTAIPVGTRPWGIAITPDGKTIYVGNYSGSVSVPTSISVIDAPTNTVSSSIALPGGVFPSGISVHPDGTLVYVASYSTGFVYLIDTATNTLQSSTQVGLRPYGFGNFITLPQPGVALLNPNDAGVYKDPNSLISLEYFGQCQYQKCALGPSYYDKYQLTATLNGNPIGPSFVKDNSYWGLPGMRFFYTPPTRLPEGLNTLTFKVTDRYGHSSPLQSASFTIDTIPPEFLSLSPANGAVVFDPNVTVSGTINDPTAYVYGDPTHLAPGAIYTQAGPSFSYPVVLAPGANMLSFQAYDPAGNNATANLSLTYVPFSLTITNPQNGVRINTPQTTVSGFYSGASAATVSVNGVAATVTGTSFSAANVPVPPGYSLLVATGRRTSDGKVVTQSVSVSGAPVLSIASPANNAILNDISATVAGSILGMSSPTVTVNGLTASLSGTAYSATVPLAYGSNTLTVTAIDASQSLTNTVVVTRNAALTVTSPAGNAIFNTNTATVTGAVLGMTSPVVTVNGQTAARTGNNYSATVPLVYGSNTLTVTAVDGNQTQTQTISVTSTAPSVTITGALGNGNSTTISGTFQGPAGTTITVNGVAATITGNAFSAPVPLVYGPNTVQIVATSPGGGSATQTTTVNSIVPTLTIASPLAGATINSGTTTVTGILQGPAGTTVSVNGIAAAVSGNGFTATNVPVGYGNTTITATATAPDSSSSTNTLSVVGTATLLQIASPQGGAAINGDAILVTGRFQGPPNSGVTVNGVIANVYNGQFYANNVSLAPGANTITATYTLQDGTTSSQTINVASAGANPIQVTATDYVGLAPMTITLGVTDTTSTIQNVSFDPGSNGSAGNITVDSTSASIPLTYPTPGTYTPSVTVTDSTGTHTQSVTLVVQDPSAVDSLLRNIYGGMLTKLKTGDVTGALTAVTGGVHDKYAAVFNALQPNISTIVDQLGTLQEGRFTTELAEYLVVRNTANGSQGFLIYFLLGEDGVWRIDGM